MEYLKTMPFYKKVYFSQNDLKVFGLIKSIIKKSNLINKLWRLNDEPENIGC